MESTATPPSNTSPSRSADAAPAPPTPADFRQEIARYDREARVETWPGPRYRMTYRLLGEGPTLILAPGIATTYRVYALLLNRLSQRFRTIVYDYPGENEEDGADLRRITHDDLVSDFIGLVDRESKSGGPTYPLGISFGSTVVLKALAVEPDRFAKAAVQAGFARRALGPAERIAFALGRFVPGTLGSIPLRNRILRHHFRSYFPGPIADRWDVYVEQNGLTPIRSLTRRLSLLKRLDLRPDLGRIRAEVLLMRGAADRVISSRAQDELIAGIPAARGMMMPGVGHQPHFTHGEAMAEAISRWFLPNDPRPCPSHAQKSGGGCGGNSRDCGGFGDGSCAGGAVPG